MSFCLLLFVLGVSWAFLALKKPAPVVRGKVKTVVIDAGHGGHDSGCLGSHSQEKHVALAIALKLGQLIETHLPDVKVIYTRKTDVFVELYRRAQIANESKADLFICIHCNAGPKTAYGAETFVMGLHKTEDNLSVARRENAVILKEENYQKKYDGFDPNSPEAHIIFSLYQNAFLSQSLYFAEKVQHEFKHHAQRFNRGVKQAGFLVLYKTAMPAVLIETGFLTHIDDEAYLKAEAGQRKMAESILKALHNYKNWMEGTQNPAPDLQLDKSPVVMSPDEKKQNSENLPLESNEKTPETKAELAVGNTDVVFRVQIVSSPTRLSLKDTKFAQLPDMFEYVQDKTYKYTTGRFAQWDDANRFMLEMRKSGYTDAFVVAFKGKERISINDARALTQIAQ